MTSEDRQYHFWFSAMEKEELMEHARQHGEAYTPSRFKNSEYTHAKQKMHPPKSYPDYQYLGTGTFEDVKQ